jgi:NAD(P)-dependent dehydrogenase (short-subunit alcohol dehydrogenase family)
MNTNATSSEHAFQRAMFADRTIFVTGGGSGINLAIARSFAQLGAAVALCGRSQERLDGAAAELRALGANVYARTADVRNFSQLENAIEGSRAALGDIDVLVCGAAGNFLAKAEQLSSNGFKAVMDIDLLGSFNASRLAFEQLKRKRGSILFVSAPMAHIPHAYQSHVGAAKAGVEMLMKNLALEWGPFGIRCNSIIPGLVAGTEGVRRIFGDGQSDRLIGHIPLRRMGTVEDIGNAAVFLTSPLASYITGTSLWVDGGQALPGSAVFNMSGESFVAETSKS